MVQLFVNTNRFKNKFTKNCKNKLAIKGYMRVIVIGGGPSGMIAAITAAQKGDEVILLEKNEKLGKKLYITGKGRCNITNDCDNKTFIANLVNNPKFMLGAINKFDTQATQKFCTDNGLKIKVERGKRVFPESDKASDVIKVFQKALDKNNVDIRLNTEVSGIEIKEDKVCGVRVQNDLLKCDKVIVATGGMSYPGTGSTGDGYKFAKIAGHSVTPLLPALVGINLCEDVSSLAGVTLKNVACKIVREGKVVAEEVGEMLFTHTGVSGPIVLTISSKINKLQGKLNLVIDLKPALDESTLDSRLLRDFENSINKEFKNVISDLTVKALIPVIIKNSKINADKKVNQITKAERLNLVKTVKGITYEIKGLCSLSGAIVTCGGVDVKQINPKDMQSKLVKGLFFAGEVLDIDGLTGGFNIQIAMSTGYVAGSSDI